MIEGAGRETFIPKTIKPHNRNSLGKYPVHKSLTSFYHTHVSVQEVTDLLSTHSEPYLNFPNSSNLVLVVLVVLEVDS